MRRRVAPVQSGTPGYSYIHEFVRVTVPLICELFSSHYGQLLQMTAFKISYSGLFMELGRTLGVYPSVAVWGIIYKFFKSLSFLRRSCLVKPQRPDRPPSDVQAHSEWESLLVPQIMPIMPL